MVPARALGQVTLSWLFGLVVWGFEPLVVVEGRWETPSQLQTTDEGSDLGMHPAEGAFGPFLKLTRVTGESVSRRRNPRGRGNCAKRGKR